MAFHTTNVDPPKFERGQLKIYLFLIPIAVIMGLPIVFIFNQSFKPLNELFAFPPRFFVEQPTLSNFYNMLSSTLSSVIPLSRYLFNSLLVTVTVLFLLVLLSTMGGYALSKMRFKGKTLLMEINTIALMFVAVAVAIPRYLLIQILGMTDTYLAHILPLLALPVGLFLVKQFIDTIPDALIEAATVDGAGEWTIYCRVILPMVRPAVMTVCILGFQLVWNNLESSNMYINSESMKTLAFYMNTLASGNNNVAGQGVAAAAALIMFIPNLVLFICMQKNVMSTMAQSGIK